MRKIAIIGFATALTSLTGCAAPLPNTYSGDVYRAFQSLGVKITEGVKNTASATSDFVREQVSLPAPAPGSDPATAHPLAAPATPAAPKKDTRGLTAQELALENPNTSPEPQVIRPADGPLPSYDPNNNPNVIVEAVVPGGGASGQSLSYEAAAPGK